MREPVVQQHVRAMTGMLVGRTTGLRPRVLMLSAVALLVAAMFASFAPTPLHPVYAEAWDIGPVGVAFAGYPVGVILVVLGVGVLSDRIGRQRTALAGALAVATGCVRRVSIPTAVPPGGPA
jgi:MFS family permease